MKVLVACEYSGIVRDAFAARGHHVVSCDLLDSERAGLHWRWDAILAAYLGDHWDLMIAHPPCTDLSVSGARHFPAKIADGRQQRAIDFATALWTAPIPRIALENPVSVLATKMAPSTQTIHPWQFGHGETKATCLWLKNLPRLVPTDVVAGRESRVHRMPPGPNRWKERSRTFVGIAKAMAAQWTSVMPEQHRKISETAVTT